MNQKRDSILKGGGQRGFSDFQKNMVNNINAADRKMASTFSLFFFTSSSGHRIMVLVWAEGDHNHQTEGTSPREEMGSKDTEVAAVGKDTKLAGLVLSRLAPALFCWLM